MMISIGGFDSTPQRPTRAEPASAAKLAGDRGQADP
jgi:hypothetical protein